MSSSLSEIRYHLGDIIRQVRIGRGLRLDQLAAAAKVSIDKLSDLEQHGSDLHLSDLLSLVKTLKFDLFEAYDAIERSHYRANVYAPKLSVAPFINTKAPTATLLLELDRDMVLLRGEILQEHLMLFPQSRLDPYLGSNAWSNMINPDFYAAIRANVLATYDTTREQSMSYDRVLPFSAGRAYQHDIRFTLNAYTQTVTATTYLLPTAAQSTTDFECCRKYSNCVECFTATEQMAPVRTRKA